jgi:hypothetical protein
MLVGLADSVTVGDDDCTTTVALPVAEPPEPTQLNVYVVVTLRTTTWFPLTGLLPLHPFEAVQLVVPLEVQANVLLCPGETMSGEAVKASPGGVGVLTVRVALFEYC